MSKRFIAVTSGWIPVAVLLMLTVALATGQAREDRVARIHQAPPAAVEVLIAMPEDIDSTLDAVRLIIEAGLPARGATRNNRGAL
jgi:hypothetical protein